MSRYILLYLKTSLLYNFRLSIFVCLHSIFSQAKLKTQKFIKDRETTLMEKEKQIGNNNAFVGNSYEKEEFWLTERM